MAVFNIAAPAWEAYKLTESSWRICGIYAVLSAWGVPMLICGVGAAYLADDNGRSTGFIMKRRLPRALTGCLVWWIVSALVMIKYTRPNELDFDTFFECMGKVLGTPYNVRLLQLFAVFFAFYPLLRRIAQSEKLTVYAVAVFFAFSALVPALQYIPYVNYVNLFLNQINWGFFTSNGLYLFLGLFLLRKSFAWHERTVIYCMGILGTAAMYCCTVFLSPDKGYDSAFVSEASPFTAMQASAIIVLVKQLADKRGRLINSAAAGAAACTAYAAIPAFTITRHLFEKLIAFDTLAVGIRIPAEAALLVICSAVLAGVFRRIPVISYFTA